MIELVYTWTDMTNTKPKLYDTIMVGIVAIAAMITGAPASGANWSCSFAQSASPYFPNVSIDSYAEIPSGKISVWGPAANTIVVNHDGFSATEAEKLRTAYHSALSVTACSLLRYSTNASSSACNANRNGTFSPYFEINFGAKEWRDQTYANHIGLSITMPVTHIYVLTSVLQGTVYPSSVTLTDDDPADYYTSKQRYVVLQTNATVGNSGQPFGAFVQGDPVFTGNPVSILCTLQPLQLSMYVTPELNFGQTRTGTITFQELAIIINSGTQVPSGTYTMTSPDAKANGRINLGGGEVSMRGSSNVEYKMGQAIPVTSRDTRLEAVLDATGATPGPAEAHLTVTMTVN